MPTKAKTPRTTKAQSPVAPVTETDAPVTETVAPVTETDAPVTNRGLARDASTVAANRTNFSQYSDRDTAYLAFFGRVMRANNGSATLAQIHEAGSDAGGNKRRNPYYAGSSKATDAGAINRLRKAGYIVVSGNGSVITPTELATSNAAFNKH